MPRSRYSDQVAFRTLPKERSLMERAAKKQDRTLSEWARLTLVIEAEIQLGIGQSLVAAKEISR